MKRVVRLTLDARQDVRGAIRWYESQRCGLGRRLLEELRTSVEAIAERPGSFPIVHRDMRRCLLKNFPYGVFFFEEGRDLIACAFLDMRRHPRSWHGRR